MAYTTIDKPSDYFEAFAYTGDGNTKVNFASDFTPDMTWFKVRNNTYDHQIHDSVRGVSAGYLDSATTVAEQSSYPIASFDSDGVTTVSGNITGVNKTSDLMVSWNWKAGGTAVSNTDGSITSSVSANQTAGFSIVSYTGNSTSGATVGHGLGAVPSMIIWKDLGINSWGVYHKSLGNTNAIFLDLTNASTSFSTLVNNTTPSSSLITLGSSTNSNNSRGMIAYCFAEKQGYSKFGSYVGNGNANGTFVYTGFKPSWVMIKRTDSATGGYWVMFDNKRNTFNVMDKYLFAQASDAEDTSNLIDFYSNGFRPIVSNLMHNGSGASYIYMCFASNPFTTSTGVPATGR